MSDQDPLPPDYRPAADEEYMSPRQLAYFQRKLLDWRDALLEESEQTLLELRDESHHEVGDEADRASREANQTLDLRTRDRYRKLLRKIDAALTRIADGSYGFCEETGEPIGLARLEARPIATLCLDAQQRREVRERQIGGWH
ncbi:MAG: RNA polymerase-binding protein DksA [Chromatiaceae bacterium]|nr:MAG: RNA polymerase-binding protein DksA [Chromatiaceae bacterium]